MQVRIDRDSVCAGDDIESHDELRRYEPQMKFGYVIESIIVSGFLPSIEGAHVSWCILVDSKGVGVISKEWTAPKFVFEPTLELQKICVGRLSTIHFRYHWGEDPELLFRGLSEPPGS